MVRLATLSSKWPKMRNMVLATVAALDLTQGVRVANDMAEGRLSDIPGVRYLDPANYPTPEYRIVLDEITKEVSIPKSRFINTEGIGSPLERERALGEATTTEVQGFEKFTLSNETVEAIIKETIPHGFLRNVKSIKYVDETKLMPSEYGKNLTEGSVEAGNARSDGYIEITKGAQNASAHWIANDLILHEVFYLQDAVSNSLLTGDERVSLYKTLLDRIKSADRFKSEYVEAISNKDKSKELRYKIGEYFAEIGSTYLSSDYYLLPEADKKIISGLISKVDPTFDRLRALNRRRALIGEKIPQPPNMDEITKRYERLARSSDEWREYIKRSDAQAGTTHAPGDVEELIEQLMRSEKQYVAEESKREYDRLSLEFQRDLDNK